MSPRIENPTFRSELRGRCDLLSLGFLTPGYFGTNVGSKFRDDAQIFATDATGLNVGVTSGIVMAVAVTGFAFGLVRKLFYLYPTWDLGPMPWWVAMIGIPEVIFIAAAVGLWRKRRSMAVGILLSAVTLVTHFIIHVATHGNGQ